MNESNSHLCLLKSIFNITFLFHSKSVAFMSLHVLYMLISNPFAIQTYLIITLQWFTLFNGRQTADEKHFSALTSDLEHSRDHGSKCCYTYRTQYSKKLNAESMAELAAV